MGKGEGKGEGVMQIAANKGDYLVCSSCLFCNTYLDTSPSVCGSGTGQYCCEACDFVCVGVDSGIPMACGGQLLPGCYCYPKLACCKTAGKMLPDKAEAFGQKENWLMCNSCCCGPLGYENDYIVPPATCCACEQKQCCICVCDAALPCSPDVPMMLTLLPMCVICAPAGATKTIYLIRHAEGFHNRGATRATRRTRRARRLKSETVGDESRRKTTDGARRAPGAQRASETRRSTGARRTRTRDSRREDGDSANILKRRSSRATRGGAWRRASARRRAPRPPKALLPRRRCH